MSIVSKIVHAATAPRRKAIAHFGERPFEEQERQLRRLLERGAATCIGRDYSFGGFAGYEDFRRAVPVSDYEGLSPYIDRARRGERDVLWPGRTEWFARSSGTTSSRSKYIPVTAQGLRDSHMRGPRDLAAVFSGLYPRSEVFSGKLLTLGGSHCIEREGETARTGDLSSILIEHTPRIGRGMRVPGKRAALTADFDRKVELICREAAGEDVRSFAGVPSWNLVLMNRILEYTGKSNLLEVWPRLELFTHGGMSFKPYREIYRRLIPSPQMKYIETYNASEGFFAIGDRPERDDMLLMLDYGIFYEFLPVDDLSRPERAVPLEGVAEGVNYAMIITTSCGLWRYMIGDTVEFTSLAPHRIRITGRTRHYMNAFGEEIVVENAESAVSEACRRTRAVVREFTAAPVYMEARSKGRHQWVVEFEAEPDEPQRFARELDRALQEVNSDYAAKRFRDTTLYGPLLTVVPRGTFLEWMRRRDKVGGQNKVPRVYNARDYVEELAAVGAELAPQSGANE